MRGVTGRERLIRKNLLYPTEMTAGASAPELPPMKRMEAIRKKKIVTETEIEIENENGLVIARRIGTIEIRIEKRIASERGVVERKRRIRIRIKREIRRERRRGGREIRRKRGRERGKRGIIERRKKRKKGLGEAGAGRNGTGTGTGTVIEREKEKET